MKEDYVQEQMKIKADFIDQLQTENDRALVKLAKLEEDLFNTERDLKFWRERYYMQEAFLKTSLKSLANIMRPDKIMRQTLIRLTEVEKKLGIDHTGIPE